MLAARMSLTPKMPPNALIDIVRALNGTIKSDGSLVNQRKGQDKTLTI